MENVSKMVTKPAPSSHPSKETLKNNQKLSELWKIIKGLQLPNMKRQLKNDMKVLWHFYLPYHLPSMVTVLKIAACFQCVTHVSGSREKRADIIYKLLCFSVLSGGYLKDDTGIHLCFTKPRNHSGRKSGGHWLKTLYGDQKPHNCLMTKIMVDIYNRPPKAREENWGERFSLGNWGIQKQ